MRLKRLIGPSRTKMLLLAGQEIDSAIAQRWGLIDNTTAPNGLMSHAHALAAATRDAPLSLLHSIKGAIDG
jgi:enoyl-CoA hydratase/carnithine racemase